MPVGRGGRDGACHGHIHHTCELHRSGHPQRQRDDRAEAFKEMAKKSGIAVKDLYWTLGTYDVVAVCESPDDESATALSLSVCSRGNVRSETLRAFSFEEMKRILAKMV
jgi:uncharacterized protein with GYD domain